MKTLSAIIVYCLIFSGVLANEIMISGDDENLNLLYFVTSSPNTIPVVYDIGIPKGGLDAELSEMSDKSTIVLKNPDTRDLRHPFILVLGVQGHAGQRIDLTLGIVEGHTSFGLASSQIEVYLDETELHFEKKRIGKTEALSFLALTSSFILKDANPHLILIRPRSNDKCFIDAIKISSEQKINCLTAKLANKATGKSRLETLYLKRVLADIGHPEKINVLVMNHLAGYGRHFEYGTLKQMGFKTTAAKWMPPSKWKNFNIVILATRHKISAKENQAIDEYVKGGGIVVATPSALQHLVSRGGEVAKEELKWAGGFFGVWMKYPNGDFYLSGNPKFENKSLDLKFDESKMSMRSSQTDYFRADGEQLAKYSIYLMSHSSGGEKGAGIVFHPYHKGFFIGYPIPRTLKLQSILQNILNGIIK